MQKRGIINGLIWKMLERFGVQGIQFVLSIVLARMLDPAHYGMLSMMLIFVALANVFTQTGFSTSLIQNKDVTDEDYSSVFWVSTGISVFIYAVLFAAAPWIADFYEMPEIVAPFRVLSFMIVPGALNSIQLARLSREMDFKKVFLSSTCASLFAGLISIGLAYAGAGLWSLVAQTLLNTVISCAVMFFAVKWAPKLYCDMSRVRVLFAFGWKILVSGLLDTLYQDLRSLVIGKKYDSGTLGYYNRGKQFPQFIITSVNGAVQSVLLPAMSAKQEDRACVKEMARNAISISSYVIFPMMAGIAAVAVPLVSVLLTDKWLPCVPYMQIYCFTLAFYPINSSNLQAINAMGRSDIFLKLEIIKKVIGIAFLTIAVFCFDSPIAIAMTGVFTTGTSGFINAYPNKKLIGYSYMEQMRDILPSLAISLVMCGAVMLLGRLALPAILLLVIQVAAGVVIYMGISAVLRIEPYEKCLAFVKQLVNKRSSK